MSEELRRLESIWADAVARGDGEAAGTILADAFVLSSTGGLSEHVPRDEWVRLPA